MRPNIWGQVTPICHYVFMDEETLIQFPQEGWRGGRVCFRAALGGDGSVAVFPNTGDDPVLIQAHLLPGATLSFSKKLPAFCLTASLHSPFLTASEI